MRMTIILAVALLAGCTPLDIRERAQPTTTRSAQPQLAAVACIERNAQNNNLMAVKRPGLTPDTVEVIISTSHQFGMEAVAVIDVTTDQRVDFRQSPSLWAGDAFREKLLAGC